MKDQQRLSYITNSFVKREEFPTLRGIISKWEGDTLKLSFFFDGEISKNMKEDASVLATEILAQFPEGFLEEKYIRLDTPQSLPNSNFLSYIRK